MSTAEPSDPDVATPFDASDPQQVNERNSRAGHRTRRLRAVLQDLLAKQDGREWLWQFMADLMLTDKQIVAGDPVATAFRDGQREVGLALMRKLARTDAANFAAMLRENDG